MTKGRAPKDIRDRRKRARHKPKKQKRELLKLLVRIAVALGTFASILGLVTFLPRLTVVASESLRPKDPMGTVFTLSNDSILWLSDVSIDCGIDDIWSTNGLGFHGFSIRPFSGRHADTLSAGQKMDIPCRDTMMIYEEAARANITIEVSYRPAFCPWHRNAAFSFSAKPTLEGKWVWTAVAH